MPSNRSSAAAPQRGLILALLSGGLLAASPGTGRAADGMDFFQTLFGAPAARTAAPAPAPALAPVEDYAAPRLRRRWAGRSRAETRAALRHRTRYAALPKAAEVEKAGPPAPAERITSPSEARAALLRDPTLRSGDIVIMPEGPRVFMGERGSLTHRASEFEDVRQSRAVDARTRRDLLAMTAPIGALPADEARKLMTRLIRRGPQPWSEPPAPRTETAMRVIYPSR
ncbi:hypothetical protein [Methylobacterium sp. JK268]